MQQISSRFVLLVAVISAFGLSSCLKKKSEGYISIKLTGEPTTYKHVNVDLSRVSVHIEPKTGKSSWMDVPSKTGLFDLVTLHDTAITLVSSVTIPEGKITAVKLLFGVKNSMVNDSATCKLTVPPMTNTEFLISGGKTLNKNESAIILVDFDSKASVVKGTDGEYYLVPSVLAK